MTRESSPEPTPRRPGRPSRRGVLPWTLFAVVFIVLTVVIAAWTGRPPPLVVKLPDVARAADLDENAVETHLRELTRFPSRMSGSPGARRAFDYIRARLGEMGIPPSETSVQEIAVAVPVTRRCVLRVGDTGREIPLHPLWPNLVRTCRTPRDGIEGPLVDIGKATEAEMNGVPIRGAVVLVDWDSGAEWLGVQEFGGRAVIFTGERKAPGVLARKKMLTVPADIPRYYADPAASRALREIPETARGSVVLFCDTQWENVPAWNLLVRIAPGATARHDDPESTSPIVFQAYYDSISMVPDLAPGAEQACGAAVLLELVRSLRTLPEPPPRPLYALFTSAHGQAMAGITAFVRDLAETIDRHPDGGEGLLAEMGRPGLFVGLDLSSRSNRIGVFAFGGFRGENEHYLRPRFSTLGQQLDNFVDSFRNPDLPEEERLPDAFIDCINPTSGRGWWTYFPYRTAFESEIPNLAGFPAVSLVSLDDERRYVDTPHDTFETLRPERLFSQIRRIHGERAGLVDLALAFAYWRGPFVSRRMESKIAAIRGRTVWLDQERDYTPSEPLRGAAVVLKTGRGDKHFHGLRGIPLVLTDERGRFDIDGLCDITGNAQFQRVRLEAYGLAGDRFVSENPEAIREYASILRDGAGGSHRSLDGSVLYAVDQSRPGEYPFETEIRRRVQHLNLVVFPCRPVTLAGLTEPRGFISLTDLQILDASTDSPPFEWGISKAESFLGDPEENCMTVWADPNLRVRLTLGFGFQERRLILINNSPEDPRGTGYVLNELRTIPSWILEGAESMGYLDEWRLTRFEEEGINNPRVRKIHEEAAGYLREARAALDRLEYGRYRRAAEQGWALESRAYGELLRMANNMIRGVIFYLALLIPFSYCLERLLLASATIRGRITGMVVIFAGTFAILALVHPAFRFTLTPMLVLLSFVILVLGVTVGAMVLGKIDALLRERKHAVSGLHEDHLDVGSVTTRAVDLGIANIRRRPQRAFLTALTITLVTFTLLSFTSLVPELGISRLRHPEGVPLYRGLLVRDRNWAPLPNPLYDSLRRNFAGNPQGAVAARAWFFSDYVGFGSNIDLIVPDDSPGARARGGPGERIFGVPALVGLEPSEARITGIDRALLAGRWFRPSDEEGVILPLHVAETLGLRSEDLDRPGPPPFVRIFGREIPLLGIIDDGQVDEIRDIDGEPLTPVDFARQQFEDAQATEEEVIDTLKEYVHRPCAQVAFVPLEFARRIGGSIRSIAVIPGPSEDPRTAAESFVRRSNLTMLVSADGEVSLYASLNRSRISAAGHILVPLFLGCAMVLGTMLGSVYERRGEIFVYNSVGLSPSHVSSLFLAESAVYALMGAAVGYLLGQMTSRILLATGWLPGLTLNYSAGSAIFVAVLTMAIVLLSTIYPARQAFRAAVPEERSEVLFESGGGEEGRDRMSVYLPFVASASAIPAMLAYMYEYLDGMQGVSSGRIATEDLAAAVEQTGTGDRIPVLHFRAWLAPFDLGVSHHAVLRVVFREDAGVHQAHLEAVRQSGDQQNWRRLTPWFVMAMRKQLLLWRILPREEIRRYERLAGELFPGLDGGEAGTPRDEADPRNG